MNKIKGPNQDKPRSFGDILASYPKDVQETAGMLRSIILETLPEVTEGIHGGLKEVFSLYSIGHETNIVCGIQPRPVYCLFYIHHVNEQDAPGFRLEGKGKHNRHIKFQSPDQIDRECLRQLLTIARQRTA